MSREDRQLSTVATMMKLTLWKGTLSGFITFEATKLVQWLSLEPWIRFGFCSLMAVFL